MDMDIIRWDKSMAVRCALRYGRYETAPDVDDKSGIRSFGAVETDEHWKKFEEAMRKFI